MKTLIETKRTVNREELEIRVRKMYQEVALHPEESYHFEMGRNLAERLGYPTLLLDEIPMDAIDSFAGVGYFFDMFDLEADDKVIDLGSGSGMDVFFTANQVIDGEIIGIDMTEEQLKKAEILGHTSAFYNVDFMKAYIEELPIKSGSADVVISNGVINLSADKEKVFQEAARVLRRGGKLAIADIVTEEALPENVTCDATLWAACIGGAMQKDKYFSLIEAAGFEIRDVKDNVYRFLSRSAQSATRDYGIKSISLVAVKK